MPERVVISAGVHGIYKHPHSEAVQAYEAATEGRLYCTNRHGTVRVYGFPDGRIRVTCQRPQDARTARTTARTTETSPAPL